MQITIVINSSESQNRMLEKLIKNLETISTLAYAHENIKAMFSKHTRRWLEEILHGISRVFQKSTASRRNYLQQTERKRMLFSRAQNGRAAHEVMWMKSREISSLVHAKQRAPPFTNLATFAPLRRGASRLMQLRQLIIARPLCGNRPSHEIARRVRPGRKKQEERGGGAEEKGGEGESDGFQKLIFNL